jgi:hypothetical protein
MRYCGAAALLAAVILVSGCASSGLRYKPEPPGVGAPITADYTVLADRVRVEIDTRGARLEDAQILKPDGTLIRPQAIEYPLYRPSGCVGIGIGMGGSTWGSRGVGVGSGVSVGTTVPVGEPRTEGNTVLYFPLDQVGSAPWRLRVQITGLGPAFFMLGSDTSATK